MARWLPQMCIRDSYKTAKMYVDMGAARLGTGFSSCKALCEGGKAEGEGY